MTAPQQQKLRFTGPMVVTANRLSDGVVIYFTHDGGWSTALNSAAIVATSEEASQRLSRALRDEQHAVGAYLAPVTMAAGQRVTPGNLRERIRHDGPTITLPGVIPAEASAHVPL